MGKVTMGIGASHTTLMNTQWAKVDHLDEAHSFKNALEQASQALHANKPDLAIIIGSNHFRGHWLDLMPSFAIGVDEIISSGEHGTPEGQQKTSPEHALAIANDLLASGFDMCFSTRFVIDHGISHAIQYLTKEHQIPVVPIMVNSFAPPLPSLARCLELGAAIRDAVERLPKHLNVAVIGSGGLSHQLPFPDWRAPKSDNDDFLVDSWKNGRGDWQRYEKRRRAIIVNAPPDLNEEFDQDFLAALCDGKTRDWASGISEDELVETAGNGANEVRNWLIMHAATNFAQGQTLAYAPMPDWLTGMGVFMCQTNGN
ncbi:MAG: catechol 1,2-dioxygenase [Henriciella sp.]